MAQKKRSTSFKAWSMSRKPRLLIWPFTKTLGGAFVHSCYPGVGNLNKPIFKSSNAREVAGGNVIDALQGKCH